MKKILLLIALFVGISFNSNAQIHDTIVCEDSTMLFNHIPQAFYHADLDTVYGRVFVSFNINDSLNVWALDTLMLHINDDVYDNIRLDTIYDSVYAEVGDSNTFVGFDTNIIGATDWRILDSFCTDIQDYIYYIGMEYASATGNENIVLTNLTIYVVTEPLNDIENEPKLEYKVYPNPVTNMIHIVGDIDSIVVFDAIGRYINTYKGNNVDFSRFQKGTYYMKVNNSTIVKISKM